MVSTRVVFFVFLKENIRHLIKKKKKKICFKYFLLKVKKELEFLVFKTILISLFVLPLHILPF